VGSIVGPYNVSQEHKYCSLHWSKNKIMFLIHM